MKVFGHWISKDKDSDFFMVYHNHEIVYQGNQPLHLSRIEIKHKPNQEKDFLILEYTGIENSITVYIETPLPICEYFESCERYPKEKKSERSDCLESMEYPNNTAS